MRIQGHLVRLALATLFPALLAAALLVAFSYEAERKNLELSTLETTQALAQAVDRELAGARMALQALATSPHLASGELEAFHRQALEALQVMPGTSLALSDASGRQLVNTQVPFGTSLPPHPNPAQVARVYETKAPVVSDVIEGSVPGQPAIGIGAPVRLKGDVAYVLSMMILPERLEAILATQRLPPGWIGSILDSRGVIVARTLDGGRLAGRPAPQALVDAISAREGSVDMDSTEHEPVFAVFTRSIEANWPVTIAIPRRDMRAALWQSIAKVLAVAVALVLMGVALAKSLGERIARSIRGLIPPAMALGRGDRVEVNPLGLAEADEVAQALERAGKILREREEVLATVSHDLRSPLSSLMLHAGAAREIGERLPGGEPIRQIATSMMDIARRMAGLVDDLLAVAAARGKGSGLLAIAQANPIALLERAIQSARLQSARTGIALRLEAPSSLPDAEVDPDRIGRVLMNLLDNALKFTEPGGTVVLGAAEVDGSLHLSVANTGPALSAAELQRIFQPFWQGDAGDHRGTGLGLSICRAIVETHGGRIWAEAQPKMRLRVVIELPFRSAAARAPSPD